MYRFIQKSMLALAAVLMAGSVAVNAQRRAMPVDQSELPAVAKEFVKKHFNGLTIAKYEKKFWSNSYEIELNDGTDIDFDSKGACTEVSAPDHGVLAVSLVKEMLPEQACKTLADKNMLDKVEEIQYSPTRGYQVEVRHESIDDYRFSANGTMTRVTYDD